MKKTSLFLVICLLLTNILGCSSTGYNKENKKKAAEYQAQLGIGYLQRNRLSLAKEYLEKALKSDPNSPVVQHYYALLQERLGNTTKAGQHFKTAVKRDPRNPELLNNYGSFLCKQGAISEAESVFIQATRDPLYKTPEFALANAGICLKKKGEYQKSRQYFTQALEQRNNFSSALYHMAELSYMNRENAKAQAYLYRYNEQNPQSAETLLLCYKIHMALSETNQADECANRLLADFPQSQQVREIN